jgi:hypothetical protein
LIIFDEVHYCKNLTISKDGVVKGSQRAKICRDLAAVAISGGGGAWGLTGTPLDRDPFDLLGVALVTGTATELFPSGVTSLSYGFDATWEQVWAGKSKGYINKITGWGGAVPAMIKKLRKAMLRRDKDTVLDLPDTVETFTYLGPLPGSCRERADALWGELEAVGGDPGKLPDFSEFSAVRKQLADAKVSLVVDMALNASEPLVIGSAHRAPIDALGALEGWETISGDTKADDRQRIVDEFQAGNLKGIALTIQAGGLGITLTRASHMVCVDLMWNPGENAQFMDRIRRIGQNKRTFINKLVWDHPLDKHLMSRLEIKKNIIAKSVDTVGMLQMAKAKDLLENTNKIVEKVKPKAANKAKRKEKAADGVYKVGDKIYKVKTAGSGKRWAHVLNTKTQSFDYAAGMVWELQPEDKLPLEEAAAFGALYGWCCCCGLTLRKDESIERGVGPICYAKYF